MLEIKCLAYQYSNQSIIRLIRNTVFVDEQGVAVELEFDGCDQDAVHALLTIEGKAVGTGRLLKDGHIGRIAILKDYRGKGLGEKVVLSLVDEAKKQNLARVYLGAQKQALGFYVKLGFSVYGDEYIEAGIEHLLMEQLLK